MCLHRVWNGQVLTRRTQVEQWWWIDLIKEFEQIKYHSYVMMKASQYILRVVWDTEGQRVSSIVLEEMEGSIIWQSGKFEGIIELSMLLQMVS